jgi:2-keto-3-deoxy-L-rhamnonate aldolase RhmA
VKLGTWCLIPSPEVVSVVASAGIIPIIDREHGCADLPTIGRMIMASQSPAMPAWVRASRLDAVELQRILDLGPDGIIVPHVSTPKDATDFINYTCYTSGGLIGNRGYSPYVRNADYYPYPKYKEDANNMIERGVIIESKEGLRNLKDMVKLDIDLFYIGAYDLSLELGCEVGSVIMNNAIVGAAHIIREAGKKVGAMYHSADEKAWFHSIGVDFAVYKVDTAILHEGLVNA